MKQLYHFCRSVLLWFVVFELAAAFHVYYTGQVNVHHVCGAIAAIAWSLYDTINRLNDTKEVLHIL